MKKVISVIQWVVLVGLCILSFYFGEGALVLYLHKRYISDFEFSATLWLVTIILLILIVRSIFRTKRKLTKILACFLAFGPQLLLIISLIADKPTSSYRLSKMVDLGGRKVELAPRGPGFPVKAIDFPGNHFIPWLGWKNRISWDEASETCSRLDKEGKNLVNNQQNIWRLPTLEETREMIEEDGIWSPNFPIWWTSTMDKYEHCVASRNGQCHIIYSLTSREAIKTGYVPLEQAYRCVRDLK